MIESDHYLVEASSFVVLGLHPIVSLDVNQPQFIYGFLKCFTFFF